MGFGLGAVQHVTSVADATTRRHDEHDAAEERGVQPPLLLLLLARLRRQCH